MLAAIAGRTERIHLGSAVTVLSSDDPVRVFQRFSTLDAASGGRAEVILGRGSFIESFPLFGFPLEQYEQLFEEKLQLFAELLKEQPVTWSGATRAGAPRTRRSTRRPSRGMPTWIARRREPRVGGTRRALRLPAHAGHHRRRAAALRALRRLYHRALEQFGHADRAVGVHSHGYVARTDRAGPGRDLAALRGDAREASARERGWPPMSREQFEAGAGPEGALFVGAPETVAAKIVDDGRRASGCPAST